MPIQFELADLQLNAQERAQLAAILGCAEANLTTALRPFARASLEEYIRMFLGQKVSTRVSDAREIRFLLLVRHVFPDKIPGEQEIAALFQTTASESRSLLRSALSKHRYELREVIERTLARVVEGAQKDKDSEEDLFLFSAESQQLVDYLNQILADQDGLLPRIARRPNTVNTYVLRASSRECLCKKLGIKL